MEKTKRKVVFVHDGPMRLNNNGDLIVTKNTLLLQKRYEYLGDDLSFMMRTEKSDIDNFYGEGGDIKLVVVPSFNRISLLKNYFKAKKIIQETIKNTDIAIIRLPSTIGALAIRYVRKFNKPYIVEVVGCPWDTLINYNALGKFYAPFAKIKLKNKVKNAPYLVYVSQKFLQKRYPSKGIQTQISNVILNSAPQSIDSKLQEYKCLKSKQVITIATLGAIDVPYKGQEFVIKAIAKLKDKGYIVNYRIAGLGDKSRLLDIAKSYNVDNQVIFEGLLERTEIFKLLDNVDIYIQPSLTEGLPRAVIEAMSRGCICIGTDVGGIPELIQPDLLFKKSNVNQIAKLIDSVIRMDEPEKIALRNFELSKSFNSQILEKRRIEFYDNFILDNKL